MIVAREDLAIIQQLGRNDQRRIVSERSVRLPSRRASISLRARHLCSPRPKGSGLALVVLLEDVTKLIALAKWGGATRDEADVITKRLQRITRSVGLEPISHYAAYKFGDADALQRRRIFDLCEEVVVDANSERAHVLRRYSTILLDSERAVSDLRRARV